MTTQGRRKLAAEAFGTFCLVFAGTGAVVINDVSGGTVSHVGVALTFGLDVLAMVYALGDVWGYLTAPVLGACVGVLTCRCVQEPGCCCQQASCQAESVLVEK